MKKCLAAIVSAMSAFTAVAAFITPNDDGIMAADDSASIQKAVDTAVADGGGLVVIPARNRRTGKSVWKLDRAVLLPSDVTIVIDNARLTLADDIYENFFRGRNVWTDEGRTIEGKLSNIRIIGRGNAVLDGCKANDLNESTSCRDGRPHVRANTPILFVNTEHLEVGGLTIENHRYWGVCFEFCRYAKVHDLRFVARYDRRNQDGINLRDGCHDFTIENITGQTGDDMIALSAIDIPREDRFSYIVEGLSHDIRNVFIRNVSGAAVCHPLVALRNHNGAKIEDVVIENVNDTDFAVPCKGMQMQRYALIRIGNGSYYTTSRSEIGDTQRITIRDLRCDKSRLGVVINATLKDSVIENVLCSGECRAAVSTGGPGWAIPGATLENVLIRSCSVDSTVNGAEVFEVADLRPWHYFKDVRLDNCTLRKGGERIIQEGPVEAKGRVAPAAVAECKGIMDFQGDLTCDRSGRVVFVASFMEKLPGWKTRNYCNHLKIGVEELFGERALSVKLPGKTCDTLFELVGEEFPVEAGRGFRIDVRACGAFDGGKASGQKGQGGTALEFIDARGTLMKERFPFALPTAADKWMDTAYHGTVPAGAVKARVMLGADYPNFGDGEQLLVSKVQVSLKTPESACVPEGHVVSVPFRPGKNPFFSYGAIRYGGSSVKIEYATAPNVNGRPGEWGKWREPVRERQVPLAEGDWLKYRATLIANGSTAPFLHNVTFGTRSDRAWDLGKVKPPRVELLIASPTANLAAPISFRVTGAVEIDHAKTRICRLTDFRDSRKRVDLTGSVAREEGVYAIPPPVEGWKKGEIVKFAVFCEDILGNTSECVRLVYFGDPPKGHKVTVRGDGFMQVDGKPFFPIGIFSVKKTDFNGYDFDRAFAELNACGFNLAHTYMWNRAEKDYQEYLAASRKHGLMLLANPARMEETIPAERSANTLSWYLADDTSRHWTVSALNDRAALCHALDGARPCSQADSLGSGRESNYVPYIGCTEVFIPELYTVCSGKPIGNEVTFVGSQLGGIFRDLQKARAPAKSVWALLQHFSGWGGWERFPTAEEQRAMTYLAIARGAHGVMWYTYGSSTNKEGKVIGRGATDTPETWAALTRVTRELAAIKNDLAAPSAPEQPTIAILNGPKTDVFGDFPVSALLKDNDGDKLLIAVNTAAGPVKAKIAHRLVRRADVLFEDGRSLSTEETGYGTGFFAFTDDFAPNAVHVYRLKLYKF